VTHEPAKDFAAAFFGSGAGDQRECLRCLRNPSEVVEHDDGTATQYCEEHWGRGKGWHRPNA